MSPTIVLIFIAVYFAALLMISWLTSRKSNNETFFVGNHQSPWYIVAFGLIGTTLSGVTFISVTGMVGRQNFGYLQMVLGFIAGYFLIAFVLLPLYYRLNLTSIYTYLDLRYGIRARRIGSFYFILSRTLGAAARLFLVVIVLEDLVFSKLSIAGYSINFEFTAAITLGLIYLYTFRSGIKTIIWTDTLQTTLLLLSIITSIFALKELIGMDWGTLISTVSSEQHHFTNVFTGGFDGFLKSFIAGVFICVTMTGLDQGMMQRSLSCKNLWDAQKNILSFSVVLLIVNILFLCIGAMLALYTFQHGLTFEKSDLAFGQIASTHFGKVAAGLFVMGLIAATFSSADDAMAALTTSFCIDILQLDKESKRTENIRKLVHFGFALLLFLVIKYAFQGSKEAVINSIFLIASYTYGPLLGLYAFGLYTKRSVNDKFIPWITIISPVLMIFLSSLIGYFSLNEGTDLASYFEIIKTSSYSHVQNLVAVGLGNEVIFYNGLFCFTVLLLLSRKGTTEAVPA